MQTKTWLTVAAAAAILSSASVAGAVDTSDKEKCYGVAAVGKNDCGNKSGKHSCAGQSTVDRAGDEWVYLPQGTCERLAGGSLKPVENSGN